MSAKVNTRTVGTALLLVVVVGAPAAASWHGLSEAGATALGLPGAWSALVPLVLDAAGAYAAVLSVRDVLSGDSAAMNRLLVWAYALGSAGFNAWHADRVGGLPAALFYALASISAVLLWDRTLRAVRRDRLREAGAVSPPAPRFRMARWLVAPGETGRAWRAAVVEGITDPADAVRLVRLPLLDRPALPPAPTSPETGAPALTELSKADAVRRAVAELGEAATAREVSLFLAGRGVEVAPTYVSDVARRDAAKSTPDAEPLRLAS